MHDAHSYVQQGLGLTVDAAAPLVVCITRLVPQKGIHLIRHSVYRTDQQVCACASEEGGRAAALCALR